MIRIDSIFNIASQHEFERIALQIFRYQAVHCKVYRSFIENMNLDPSKISALKDIPFMPIDFFKKHTIISGDTKPEITFISSGTTGAIQSQHLVSDLSVYEKSFKKSFELTYGSSSNYAIIGLLPSYLEGKGSSLIYMVNAFIGGSKHPQSGFFLYNHTELFNTLTTLQKLKIPTVLIGVTYALLDFVEDNPIQFPELIIMETGGMKGKRKEMIREELHHILCKSFGVSSIHSEYGMTELLSQAYSPGNGLFYTPAWMQIYIRDTNDPLTYLNENQTGGINVIDLANINSCSFIATQDLGKKNPGGSFEVLGRFDNSDIRGCNLLVQ